MPMIKSQHQREPGVDSLADCFEISVFETQMGWLAIAGRDGVLTRVKIGHPSEGLALKAFVVDEGLSDARIAIEDWNPELREQLTRFADGEPILYTLYSVLYTLYCLLSSCCLLLLLANCALVTENPTSRECYLECGI